MSEWQRAAGKVFATTLAGDLSAAVRVNWSYWIADCPAPSCTGAEHIGLRDGDVGLLTPTSFTCRHCGWSGPALWPEPEMRQGVEALLGLRDVPASRNWFPWETLVDLDRENRQHGIVPPMLPGQPDGLLLLVADRRIVHGMAALTAGAAGLRAIGGGTS